MDDTVLKIALAAFMHDIGKLVPRETLHISEEYINNHADLYQPFYQGRHTHLHAVYTAAFIEKMQDRLPKELNQAQWGEGDAFINMAAKHHRPETPMQWVVTIADWISSGWDREPYDQESQTSWRDYQRVRLVPVLEQLGAEPIAAQVECSYGYPLREISPTNIFPRLKREVEPVDAVVANQEYKCHFEKFIDALRNLKHREENLELWFEHFDSLVMLYTSAMPSDRSGKVVPDVSLYDHARTTAALAVAIYLYHQQTATVTIDAIKDYADQKFLLINGDFYGIQDFIFSRYGDLRKYRSKILRGRSFAVSLFSELAADLACREIGLPFSSVILNNAGKFTIIAPNTPEAQAALQNVETKVNKWLMEVSYGENALGFSWRAASAHDLVAGNFPDLWEQLGKDLERKKLNRIDLSTYAGPVSGYLDNFNNDLNPPLCPLCGKRPAAPEVAQDDLVKEAGSSCKLCRDHIFLGTNLVKKKHLAITTREAELRDPDNMLREPIFGYYQVAFLEGDLKNLARSGQLLKHWDLALAPDGAVPTGITTRFISGYVPVYREGDQHDERLRAGGRSETKKLELIDQIEPDTPKTLEHIAAMARNPTEKPGVFQGIDALGILKADIDNLGLLMACGLDPKRFTLSRLATLSRQLNNYFTLYLPHLLSTDRRYQDIYTVFAGGDDLFLIGPWNRIIELARHLRAIFADYVCRNPAIHFSAGISLQKPHTPIDHLARAAESALEQSKDADKNRLTLFGETATWEEFEQLQQIKQTLGKWLAQKWINQAMLYRLNELLQMAGEERRVVANNEVYLDDMACTRWRAMAVYFLERNIGKEIKAEERRQVIDQTAVEIVRWLEVYGSKLKMPLWEILYNQRGVR